MSYFTHHLETVVARHPLGTYDDTVVYLPDEIALRLPFAESPRLRIEADASGIPVKGVWQPARGTLAPEGASLSAKALTMP